MANVDFPVSCPSLFSIIPAAGPPAGAGNSFVEGSSTANSTVELGATGARIRGLNHSMTTTHKNLLDVFYWLLLSVYSIRDYPTTVFKPIKDCYSNCVCNCSYCNNNWHQHDLEHTHNQHCFYDHINKTYNCCSISSGNIQSIIPPPVIPSSILVGLDGDYICDVVGLTIGLSSVQQQSVYPEYRPVLMAAVKPGFGGSSSSNIKPSSMEGGRQYLKEQEQIMHQMEQFKEGRHSTRLDSTESLEMPSSQSSWTFERSSNSVKSDPGIYRTVMVMVPGKRGVKSVECNRQTSQSGLTSDSESGDFYGDYNDSSKGNNISRQFINGRIKPTEHHEDPFNFSGGGTKKDDELFESVESVDIRENVGVEKETTAVGAEEGVQAGIAVETVKATQALSEAMNIYERPIMLPSFPSASREYSKKKKPSQTPLGDLIRRKAKMRVSSRFPGKRRPEILKRENFFTSKNRGRFLVEGDSYSEEGDQYEDWNPTIRSLPDLSPSPFPIRSRCSAVPASVTSSFGRHLSPYGMESLSSTTEDTNAAESLLFSPCDIYGTQSFQNKPNRDSDLFCVKPTNSAGAASKRAAASNSEIQAGGLSQLKTDQNRKRAYLSNKLTIIDVLEARQSLAHCKTVAKTVFDKMGITAKLLSDYECKCDTVSYQ